MESYISNENSFSARFVSDENLRPKPRIRPNISIRIPYNFQGLRTFSKIYKFESVLYNFSQNNTRLKCLVHSLGILKNGKNHSKRTRCTKITINLMVRSVFFPRENWLLKVNVFFTDKKAAISISCRIKETIWILSFALLNTMIHFGYPGCSAESVDTFLSRSW